MIINQFSIGYVDLSWILSRNCFAIAARGDDYTAADVVRMTIQSLSKWLRLGLSVDKLIFFRDTWDSSLKGYIRTAKLREAGAAIEYKGTRQYMTEDLLEEIRSNPESTEEDIKKAEKEYYFNTVKNEAKRILIGELGKFGISTISVPGWEFDDLATLASHLLYNAEKPSIIVSKDSDLLYSTSPKCSVWQPPLGSKPEKLVTYDEAYRDLLPDRFKGRLSLYQYFAMSNSTGAIGHNDVSRTLIAGKNVDDAIDKVITYNDFSDFDQPEIFMKQYNSFDIWNFPRIEEAKRLITECIHKIGHLGSVDEFHNFCNKYNITGISDRYYSDFISKFDPKMFCD